MTDDPPTPKLVFGWLRPVDLARLFLVFVPCAPGLIFLVIGLLRDPLWPAQDPTPAMEAAHARAAWQAHQLYLTGGIMLMVGTLGAAVVVWKIARTKPEEQEKDEG